MGFLILIVSCHFLARIPEHKNTKVHFRFDKIFIPEETNEDVQNHIGRNVVDFVMKVIFSLSLGGVT